MAHVTISSAPTQLAKGLLQLQNGVALDGTLRYVTDQNNNASQLKLSNSATQVAGTLQITTNNSTYLDIEDGSGNNRFTVSREPSSQQVNVDFASNPTGSTTTVGAIRTYKDGVNLSEVMTFREDGNVGIGTTTPTSKLDVRRTTNTDSINLQTGSGGVFIQSDNGGGSSVYVLQAGVGIGGSGGITPIARLQVVGSGSTSATTSLLVQNSAGQQSLKITDDSSLNFATNMKLTWTGGASSKNMFMNDSASGWGGFIFNSSLTYSGNVNELLVVATTKNAFKLPLAIGVALNPNDNLPLMSDSAVLQADSTTQGFLPPRMTTAQKNAIVTPAIGLMVFDTTLGRPCFYNGAWITL